MKRNIIAVTTIAGILSLGPSAGLRAEDHKPAQEPPPPGQVGKDKDHDCGDINGSETGDGCDHKGGKKDKHDDKGKGKRD